MTVVDHFLVQPAFVGVMTDAFTRQTPLDPPDFTLDKKVGAGWRPTGFAAAVTPHGHLFFPHLRAPAQRPTPPAGPTRVDEYRLRSTDSGNLIPDYPTGTDALFFNLSRAVPFTELRIPLLPGPTYPYGPHLPVAHGRVVSGATGVDASVSLVGSNGRDQCRTDGKGRFSLCLRSARSGTPFALKAVATDGRSVIRTFNDLNQVTARSVVLEIL
jgi:hypothetical protein